MVFAQSKKIKIVDAFPVQRSTRPLPLRSWIAKASRLLWCSSPVPQPTSDDTRVATQLRGMEGEKTSAMADGTNRRGRELDEGLGSGSGGIGQAPPDNKRDGYGQCLGPPPEVRVPAAPLRKNPLIRKRLVPAVAAVEHVCYGKACDDVRESPILDESVHGYSTAFSVNSADGVSAMADSVSSVAEEAEVQTVTGGTAEARRESRRVAAARLNAARIRDDPTLNKAMACIHRKCWLEAMLDELHSLSKHGVFELYELPLVVGRCRPNGF